MAAIHGIGEAEASEDDSISLTSTVPSFHDEDEVYLIEDIVAERKTKHGLEYFVRWTGYPVERNSWEPRQNFQSDEILDEWQTRKMRISRGRESAFDIRAWEKRSEELEDAAEARRQRRERKRRRLNRLDDELDELSSVSVDEHAHVSVKDRAAKRNGSMSQRESSTSSYEEHPQEVIWTEEEKRALTKGLQDANGPNWRGILDWYGSSGSKSRVLNHKLVRDLKRKAAELRKEFVDAGREPPEWLKLRTIPRAKEPKIPKSKSRDALIKRRDSTASVDSLLEEIKQKSSKKAKGVLKGLPKQKEASCSIENQSVKAKSSTTDTSKDTVNVSKTTRTARAAESDPSKVVAQGAKHAESTSKRDGSDKQKGICGADQAPKKHVPIRKNVSGTVRPADMPASGPPQIQSGDRAIKRIATTGINTAPERGEPKATINSGIVRSATTPVSKSSGPQPVREGLKGSGNAKSPVENSSRSNPNTSRLVSSGPTKSSVEDSSRPKPSRPDPAGGRSAKSPVEDSTQPQPTRPGLVVLKLPRSPAEAASRPQPALLDSAGSKPAQPPVEASLQPIPARSGVPGSGPARSSSSKAKTSASSRNPTLTGIDMVMDRNAKPRFRGPESTATSKGVVEKPGKVWKMAVQNRVKKIRQLEPAPNPDHLIFVDPKTGKTPKASSSATAAAAGNQEVDSGITGKETGHLQVQQSEAASPNEDDMIIDSSELANASSRDIEARQDGVITSVVQARPISASVNQINKTPVSKLLSDPLAALPADSASLSTLSGPSPDTPVGPKRNLYDAYRPLKHPEINTNLTARPEPNSPSSHLSSFTLMTNPTYWQKQNVCRARDSTTIIGHLWLGAEVGPETIPKQDMLKVKFLGLDKQMHRELLKIKVQPTTMIFNFRKTCLASEYLHYFPTVSYGSCS